MAKKTPDHSEGTRNVGRAASEISKSPPAPAQAGHNSQATHAKKHAHKFRIRDVDFDSTCLASATYDPNTEELYDVYFQDGRGPYEYSGVDMDTFKALKLDCGAVFNSEVR